MNTINVNGQNGVATSAMIKDAVVKAVKQINKAEIGKKGYVLIDEGLRLSFDGARFIKEGKDNFIFNGKIAKKGGNGRYDQVLVVIHYKNLDNKEGLCLDDMVNAVLVAILNDIDSAIVKYEAADSDYSFYTQTLQNFRNEFFGSILVVDNSEVYEAPMLEEGYTIEEVRDDDITDEGYSVEGLKYLAENMPVVPVDAIVEGVVEYFSDHYNVVRKRCMGFYECEIEEFCDIVWSYVWPIVCPMSDDALEAETRYYMEFDDRLRYMLDNGELGALYIHNGGYIRSSFDVVTA